MKPSGMIKIVSATVDKSYEDEPRKDIKIAKVI